VRARIGLAGQSATVDGLLSGRANLELIGRLYHLPRRDARRRAEELLERFGIADAGDRIVRTYSGGMRRRLDLAASLVVSPPVLFLDEPTTGLDPLSRNELWELLEALVRGGATLILTTQYLEEADRLADQIVVLDHGRIVADGSPTALKARVGGARIELTLEREDALAAAVGVLSEFAEGRPVADTAERTVVAPLRPGTRLIEIVRALDAAGIDAVDIRRREATLDDVFLSLTGAAQTEAAA
jgi:ABC-2 type transport system ATP-binding protein